MTNGFVVPGLDSQEAYDLLAERFPAEGGISAQVVIEAPAGSLLSDPAQQTAITAMTQAFQSIEGVAVVVPPLLGQTVSESGTIGLFRIGYRTHGYLPSQAMLEDLEEAGRESAGGEAVLRVEFGGDLYNATEQPETGLGELLGLVSAVLQGVALNFWKRCGDGTTHWLGVVRFDPRDWGDNRSGCHRNGRPEWTPNMASMIGLGVGIDYALFIVTRFREGLADGLTVDDAAGRANATAGLSVIFAGGTVVIAILGLAMAGIPFMTAAAVAVSIVVGLMVIASLTILPALLGWAGHHEPEKEPWRGDRS